MPIIFVDCKVNVSNEDDYRFIKSMNRCVYNHDIRGISELVYMPVPSSSFYLFFLFYHDIFISLTLSIHFLTMPAIEKTCTENHGKVTQE